MAFSVRALYKDILLLGRRGRGDEFPEKAIGVRVVRLRVTLFVRMPTENEY